MIINNQKQAVNLRIQKFLALLILVVIIGLIYFANIIPRGLYGLNKNQVAVGIIMLFAGYFIFDYLRNYYYISYNDTGDKFILRYFSLRPLEDRKHAIEFNKNEFHSFELVRSFFGLNETLIIYRSTSKGVAKYPGVSLSAISKADKEKMIASFQKLIRVNKK
jgi:hypothetical protein